MIFEDFYVYMQHNCRIKDSLFTICGGPTNSFFTKPKGVGATYDFAKFSGKTGLKMTKIGPGKDVKNCII